MDPQNSKQASGLSIFLSEEVGDARLQCNRLKKLIDEATQLVEKSEQKDHIFEVAGHLITSIPDTLVRLSKALDSTSMALGRWEFEEMKDTLGAEKAEQLETALEDVRVKQVQKQDKKASERPMKATETIERLKRLASDADAGNLDTRELVSLIKSLSGKKASAGVSAGEALRQVAASLEGPAAQRPAPSAVASTLKAVLASSVVADAPAEIDLDLGSVPYSVVTSYETIFNDARMAMRRGQAGQHALAMVGLAHIVQEISVILSAAGDDQAADKAFMLSKFMMAHRHDAQGIDKLAADAMEEEELGPFRLSDAYELIKAKGIVAYRAGMAGQHKLAFSHFSMIANEFSLILRHVGDETGAQLADRLSSLIMRARTKVSGALSKGDIVDAHGAKRDQAEKNRGWDAPMSLLAKRADDAVEDKAGKFEEGEPADPTENMSEEDASKWKIEHLKNKDNFTDKEASKHEVDKLVVGLEKSAWIWKV